MPRVGSGVPEPLGLTLVPGGANVAVYSAHADAIELCLFDANGQTELKRIALSTRTGDVFHASIAEVSAGQRYGLRAHGPYDPANGHRFNSAKLLVDPYAMGLDRRFELHPAMFGELPGGFTRNDADSAPFVPKGIALARGDAIATSSPRVPWAGTILYELHVRGFTRLHPEVPEGLRGTCAGLAHPAAIRHLTSLGVTTVELMPVAAVVDERHLARLGLTNYWGYNPVAFFVPDPRLAPGGLAELRACIDALHAANIEVVLDVVLNHTGEGDERGPTLSLRGLDNATYYRLRHDDRARYVDDTGCGNTLALDRPPVLRLALDVLRHYAGAGVDGFRFDLATTLARRDDGYDATAPFLQAIANDARLRDLKLIAEPWDVGPGGYRLGAFPDNWAEWNDRYRDSVRRFWRADSGTTADFATRLAGSSDIFAPRRRPPSHSINYVAAHDGFTLADVVSYTIKHNEANGEGNRDGIDANYSWNHGIEGTTADATVQTARERDVRSLLATLLVSRGTPMLSMGDETGRTQGGNNNAYAQDGACAWLDWEGANHALSSFVSRVIELRKLHCALRMDRWLTGGPVDGSGIPDVEWRRADGRVMTIDDWNRADNHVLVVALYAEATDDVPADRVVVAFNASHEDVTVVVPDARAGRAWRLAIDTSSQEIWPTMVPFDGRLASRSMIVAAEDSVSAQSATEDVRSSHARSLGVEPEVLAQLAAAAGIAPDWWEVSGRHHIVGTETTQALLDAMGLGARTTPQARERLAEIVARRSTMNDELAQGLRRDAGALRCFLPSHIGVNNRRSFGLAAHLYALRRRGDQGIGDFTTLEQIAADTARAGGVAVGINPLHALFPHDRERASPYHPSDRRFLDPMYIDVERVPDFDASPAARELYAANADAIVTLRARDSVDYDAVWQLKHAALTACFDRFELRSGDDPLVEEFHAFVSAGGRALRDFALFEAIAADHPRVPWQYWPAGLRGPDGRDTSDYESLHARSIRFTLYQQWIADRQLAKAAQVELALGLYRDLAVGCAPDGAEAWAHTASGLLARGATIGAPPDPFSLAGQNWNLPPPIPLALGQSAYASFRELVAANMRHAGALRIDHVMGLARLFWIPEGGMATEGAYVRYPVDDLLAVLAQESIRARCVVVGEDLGTVPEGLRERLSAASVLSYRVVWFERQGLAFKPPSTYPPLAATCVSTHDLPTIAGWWTGADIEERLALRLITVDDATDARAHRHEEKKALISALNDAGIATRGAFDETAPHSPAITAAIHRFAAASLSTLMLLQADDLSGETEALNLPGTHRERPNWRRKVRTDVSELWQTPIGAQAIDDLQRVWRS